MKTGLVVTLAALALATACSGNRTEPPAKEAAPVETSASETAHPVETPPPTTAAAPRPTEIATTTTTPPPATSAPAPVEVIERVEETPPPPPPPAPAPPAQKPTDPLELLRETEAKRADYQQKLAAAEAKVVETNAAVGQWQNTILAFRNPFRPRPALTAADAQAIEGKDGVSRVSWAEGKLAEAMAARDAAQKALDDLKASPPY